MQIPADPRRCFQVFITTNCVPVSLLLPTCIDQPRLAGPNLATVSCSTAVPEGVAFHLEVLRI